MSIQNNNINNNQIINNIDNMKISQKDIKNNNIENKLNNIIKNVVKVKTKCKKNRCSFPNCNKKIKLTDTQCKCGNKYCLKHRIPEDHNCTFDYKNNDRLILENKLMNQKTVSEKIIKV